VGSIGERHLRCFLSTERVEASICEVRDELREDVGSRYEVAHAFASLEEARKEDFDAAVVATPAHVHVPIATQLAERGSHLLIEKPLSVSLEGVAELGALAAARDLVAGVAYNWRAHPGLTQMRKAITEGRFGRPVQIITGTGQHFPTYRPAYREIYYTDRATGGGGIQDGITHMLNAGEWLLGPIERLVCDAEHQVLDGVTVEDTVHILTRQEGALGTYTMNQYQAPNEVVITVVCDGGTARLESQHSRWGWMTEPETPWEHQPFTALERDTMYAVQAEAFLDALEGKREPLCSLQDGIQTLRVNLAALESLEQREWKTINT